MKADLLSDTLSLFLPVTHIAGAFDLGGDWALAFPEHEGLKVFAVETGRAWLQVAGESEALLLEANDCVILPGGRAFRLAQDLSNLSTPVGAVSPEKWQGDIATIGGGGDTLVLGGHFAFSGGQTVRLLGEMPPILRLREPTDKRQLRGILEWMRIELATPRPGKMLVVRNLAHMLLVQALRLYLASGSHLTRGWLFALADPQIAAAVQAMHSSPGRRWTLAELSAEAGMSRTRFAERFRRLTGHSPVDYLVQWRMMLACRELDNRAISIAALAELVGYRSEAAFGTAFKRVVGCSPYRYGRMRRENASASNDRDDPADRPRSDFTGPILR